MGIHVNSGVSIFHCGARWLTCLWERWSKLWGWLFSIIPTLLPAAMSAIRRKFTHSNRPYVRFERKLVGILFDGVVHKTDAVFQSWNFSDLVTRLNSLHRLNPLQRLKSIINDQRRPTSDEEASNELFDAEDQNQSSTQASAQTSFQKVRLLQSH